MTTQEISPVDRITQLRDEVKLRLHLATLEVKKEWDEKLEPKVFEVEKLAKDATETAVSDLVQRLEEFVIRLRPTH